LYVCLKIRKDRSPFVNYVVWEVGWRRSNFKAS
jgi:hypothetical protein